MSSGPFVPGACAAALASYGNFVNKTGAVGWASGNIRVRSYALISQLCSTYMSYYSS